MPGVSSPFPPIESFGFLSNGEVTALVAPDGSIEWLCLPRMDGPSVFAAILDRDAGRWRFGAGRAERQASRRYLQGSLVLETTWETATGRLTVRDALLVAPGGRPLRALVRVARCDAGEVELELECDLRFDYGREPADWAAIDGSGLHTRSVATGLGVALRTDLPLRSGSGNVTSSVRLAAGDRRYACLTWGDGEDFATLDDAEWAQAWTVDHWRDWLTLGSLPDHPWRSILERSALTLKGLIHAPTGAPIAAATTSLPETPGGPRNWDYRYTWLRDGVFTLSALGDLGFLEEASTFVRFIAALVAGGEELQVMYGVGGERELPESTLDHLTGYEGARPVRIGNDAVHQRQHDVWGVLLDLVLRDAQRHGVLDPAIWAIVPAQAEAALSHWREPDRGVWEVRGEPRHFTSSKLMAWVALDRGAQLARMAGDAALEARWAGEAEAVHADICANGLDGRGVFTQAYGETGLDASMLLMPLMGFLPADDERLRRTVLTVADELTEDGLVLRYRVGATEDGLWGEEGSFTICSFWLVSALARMGEGKRARRMFDRLLAHASTLGLYAEELDPRTGRHLGNMPQAFSHLALIGAALDLIALDGESSTM